MTVELHSAFVFDCEHCGRENFARAIEADLEEGAAQAIAADMIDMHFETNNQRDTADGGMESPDLITKIALAPAFVTCAACGKTFPTELYHHSEDEDQP